VDGKCKSLVDNISWVDPDVEQIVCCGLPTKNETLYFILYSIIMDHDRGVGHQHHQRSQADLLKHTSK
jgi:hypothetical protein